jgi:hypothetical protein
MSDKRKQFVRIMDQAIGLLRQANSAGSLAPQRHLSDTLRVLIAEAEALRDNKSLWFYGQDSQGRFQTESGEVIEDAG